MTAQDSTPSLPSDTEDQVYVTVHAFTVGGLWFPAREVFQDSLHEPETVGSNIPFIAFLVTHPTKGRALFDLGLRKATVKNNEGYPPGMESTLEEFKVYCKEDMEGLLRQGGIEPTEIDRIIYSPHTYNFSHLHWDHVGDPTPFTSAEIILGAESKPLLAEAFPHNPASRTNAFPDDRTVTFVDFGAGDAQPFGTFARAVDLYDDGSLYLIDSPGHMPGNLALAARVGPGAFVLHAGDTCHSRESYDPATRPLSELNYADLETARATVQRLARLHREFDNVVVVLSHEKERVDEMPLFPTPLNEWALGEIEKRRRARKE
ncbi:hypothetical protein PHLGIDRAFT_79929 [Phlebiopsis gigantea 11061_1 CR5-6]|uniref:Metallo-beta-lactamase domain-containing protein n=1 Tax=Phlebiopsis gigantea (strain 11061_1 CR5-6) TaxID=745531 RepID=A0A0C3RZJ6_PHLG1|nr:hypothetical protein PHLGIDRAFT_79929 [Phlebiopsis gigantea 11061_1 CR5-6]